MREKHGEWLERWERGEAGWHMEAPNPELVEHRGEEWKRVLVPLCGASLDLGWLREQGVDVVGVELSPIAVGRVFAGLGVEPATSAAGAYVRHSVAGLTVLEGDIMHLTEEHGGRFDAVWDRAALVAIEPAMRVAYAAALGRVAGGAELLLSVFAGGDPALGPPYPVSDAEVRALFDEVTVVSEQDVTARFAERGREGEFVQRLYRARVRQP